jgi:hypothetical protein
MKWHGDSDKNIFDGKRQGKRLVGGLSVDTKIIIKLTIDEQGVRLYTGFIWIGIVPVAKIL